jgi:hypothetical protein
MADRELIEHVKALISTLNHGDLINTVSADILEGLGDDLEHSNEVPRLLLFSEPESDDE